MVIVQINFVLLFYFKSKLKGIVRTNRILLSNTNQCDSFDNLKSSFVFSAFRLRHSILFIKNIKSHCLSINVNKLFLSILYIEVQGQKIIISTCVYF